MALTVDRVAHGCCVADRLPCSSTTDVPIQGRRVPTCARLQAAERSLVSRERTPAAWQYVMERVEGWGLEALKRTCLFSSKSISDLPGPVCTWPFNRSLINKCCRYHPKKVKSKVGSNGRRARTCEEALFGIAGDMTDVTKMYNNDEKGPRSFEQKPLLLIDGDGPYSGIRRMDRPFGTSSKRYWALFVFVMLSIVQNIVSDN